MKHTETLSGSILTARKLKVEFHGTKVISDGGLPTYRELDEGLGVISTVDSELCDIRNGEEHRTRHHRFAQTVDIQQAFGL